VIDFVAFALQQNKPTLTDSLAYNLLKDFSLPLLAIIWAVYTYIDKQTESYPFAKSGINTQIESSRLQALEPLTLWKSQSRMTQHRRRLWSRITISSCRGTNQILTR